MFAETVASPPRLCGRDSRALTARLGCSIGVGRWRHARSAPWEPPVPLPVPFPPIQHLNGHVGHPGDSLRELPGFPDERARVLAREDEPEAHHASSSTRRSFTSPRHEFACVVLEVSSSPPRGRHASVARQEARKLAKLSPG